MFSLQSLIQRAKENDIQISLMRLHETIWGMVYQSVKGNYHIVINNQLNLEMQKKVAVHELKHIHLDLPVCDCIVGLDMQHNRLEKDADKIASLFLQNNLDNN